MAAPLDYNLPSSSLLQRSSAAGAALLIVLSALNVFQFGQRHFNNRDLSRHESQLVWFKLPTPAITRLPPPSENTPRASIRPSKQTTRTNPPTINLQSVPITPEIQVQLETKSDFDEAFKTKDTIDRAIASKSTGIDDNKLRRAYQDSKTELQKQAEKSGTPLADARLTQQEKFQQAANRAAKPDCLRQGGSILSLFVVAYQVATDHCK